MSEKIQSNKTRPKRKTPWRKKEQAPQVPPRSAEPAQSAEQSPAIRRRWLPLFFLIASVVLMTLAGAAVAGFRFLANWSNRPYGAAGKTVEFKIAPGTPFMDVSAQLAIQGMVSDANLFRAFAVIERKHAKLQAGVYRIKLPVTPSELIERMLHGTFQGRITIPEGWTARQMDDYLFENNWIAARGDWLRIVAQPVGAEVLGEPLPRGAEGFCFPDTYLFEEGTAPKQIRDKMLARFAQVWRELDPATRDPRSADLTMAQIVALASIVERETRKPDESRLIASVFLNRLAKRMKLQSCATVHYALGEVWTRKLTYEDLKVESEFNTYRITGLPAGPIGSPGRGAIEAVLRPAATNDLYFVHRGDGTHEFTKTYRDHQRAARKYQRADPHAALVKGE